jgi:hypothetical protein
MPLNLPTLFARCPPKKEDKAAGMRIVETTSPCTVEESEPNVVANWGIVVRGPIVPVSSLGRIRRGWSEGGRTRGWGVEVPEQSTAEGDQCCLLDVFWWMEP